MYGLYCAEVEYDRIPGSVALHSTILKKGDRTWRTPGKGEGLLSANFVLEYTKVRFDDVLRIRSQIKKLKFKI